MPSRRRKIGQVIERTVPTSTERCDSTGAFKLAEMRLLMLLVLVLLLQYCGSLPEASTKFRLSRLVLPYNSEIGVCL